MSNQRKLTALLHELQNARSPLAQARVLARAWRTVRELSPTDRRLLARHAGFDGAEEILEGLKDVRSSLGIPNEYHLFIGQKVQGEECIFDLCSIVRTTGAATHL